MRVDFHASAEPTLGIEWEFALVDRESRDLVNAQAELFEEAAPHLKRPEQLHKEMLRNTVELVTGVCHTVGEAVAELTDELRVVADAGDRLGLDLFGAGTHPFADWSAQQLTAGHRYEELITRTQWWGRQMLIWGVHVHVGMPAKERRDARAVGAADDVSPPPGAVRVLPRLGGRRHRLRVQPGADVPAAADRGPALPVRHVGGVRAVLRRPDHDRRDRGDGRRPLGIRPAPHLGTLEHRVCDGVSTVAEIGALAALVHCLVIDLDTRLAGGEPLPTLPVWHVQENKWRAARYGLDAIVITDADNSERLVTDDLADLLEHLAPTADRLGCAEELAAVAGIPTGGASYQRQRAVAEQHDGDLVAVVDAVVAELKAGL